MQCSLIVHKQFLEACDLQYFLGRCSKPLYSANNIKNVIGGTRIVTVTRLNHAGRALTVHDSGITLEGLEARSYNHMRHHCDPVGDANRQVTNRLELTGRLARFRSRWLVVSTQAECATVGP